MAAHPVAASFASEPALAAEQAVAEALLLRAAVTTDLWPRNAFLSPIEWASRQKRISAAFLVSLAQDWERGRG